MITRFLVAFVLSFLVVYALFTVIVFVSAAVVSFIMWGLEPFHVAANWHLFRVGAIIAAAYAIYFAVDMEDKP